MGLLTTAPEAHSAGVDICLELQAAARTAGERWIERAASQSNLQFATDVGVAAKKRRTEVESAMLTRLQATAVITKPVEWKGRKFSRPELEGDENARKKAEAADRLRWMRRVFAILTESSMPFGQEALLKGWRFDSPEAARCFRGLRAATLKKRVADI